MMEMEILYQLNGLLIITLLGIYGTIGLLYHMLKYYLLLLVILYQEYSYATVPVKNAYTNVPTAVCQPNDSNAGCGATAGSGTVTTVSVATANGFLGTVANPTTTPAITMKTSVTGLMKGDGTAVSAAVGDTDFQNPISLTTIGTSGAASFIGDVLNIPQYSGGSSQWTTTNTNDVFLPNNGNVAIGLGTTNAGAALTVMNGNVGIGTWKPTATIDIEGGTTIFKAGSLSYGANTLSVNGLSLSQNNIFPNGTTTAVSNLNSTAGSSLSLIGGASSTSRVVIQSSSKTGNGQDMILFNFGNQGIGTTMVSMISGNVGIGTVTPGNKLDVRGTTQMTGFNLSTSPTNGYVLTTDSNGTGTWQPSAAGTSANPSATIGLSAVNGSATTFMTSDSAPSISQAISPTWTGNHTFTPSSGNTLITAGNVGIGSSTPGQKLDVQGTVRALAHSVFGATSSQFQKGDGSLDSNAYITGNQTITASGDATGSGTTSLPLTFATVNTNVGSFTNANITVNGKGLITAAANGSGGSSSAAGGTNAVQYNSGSSTFAGTESIFSMNGTNVGIGTSNGLNKLDVRGTVTIRAFQVSSAGNVGIGTPSPGKPFDVVGESRFLGNVGIGTITNELNSYVSIGTALPNVNYKVTIYSTNGVEGVPLAVGDPSPNGQGEIDFLNDSGTAKELQIGLSGSTAVFEPANTGFIATAGTAPIGINSNYTANGIFDYSFFSNTDNTVKMPHNVGIGTFANPTNLVDVFGTTSNKALEINKVGNVGISTFNPFGRLDVEGTAPMIIQGNLGIGTTNSAVGIGTYNPQLGWVEIHPSNTLQAGKWALAIIGNDNGSAGPGDDNANIISMNPNSQGFTEYDAMNDLGNAAGIGISGSTASLNPGGAYWYTAGTQSLAIEANGLVAGNHPGIIVTGTNNVGIGTFTPMAGNILEVGNRKIDIDPNGNVGIGSVTPDYPLVIKGTTAAINVVANDSLGAYGFIGVTNTNSAGLGDFAVRNDGGHGFQMVATGSAYAVPNIYGILTDTGQNLSFANTGGSIFMTLDSNGNLGIGTANPQAKLTLGSGGHFKSNGIAPTVANNDCGSTTQGTVTAGSTDIKGSFTVGTLTVTSCAVTFNTTFGKAPVCLTQDDTNILGVKTVTTTTKMTTTSTTSMSGDVINYHCIE